MRETVAYRMNHIFERTNRIIGADRALDAIWYIKRHKMNIMICCALRVFAPFFPFFVLFNTKICQWLKVFASNGNRFSTEWKQCAIFHKHVLEFYELEIKRQKFLFSCFLPQFFCCSTKEYLFVVRWFGSYPKRFDATKMKFIGIFIRRTSRSEKKRKKYYQGKIEVEKYDKTNEIHF